jgi:hypothetical protein
MRVHLADFLLAAPLLLGSPAITIASDESRKTTTIDAALAYFVALPRTDAGAALRAVRPLPVDPVIKRQALDRLPREGELRPSVQEAAKLESLAPVFAYHTRYGILEVKVIDVPQGFVGLYARSALLVSRPALRLLSAAEVQALAAHEMGHEYVWDAYELARVHQDVATLRQLELICDGIAVLTLQDLGLDSTVLMSATRKLTRFNAAHGASANGNNYPDLTERAQFVEQLVALWPRRP